MKKIDKIRIKDINKLVEIIERFYEVEHFSENGTPFTFGDKPNINRVRFLLEGIIEWNAQNYSLSDREELFGIFSRDMIKYLNEFIEMENLINNNADLGIFLQDFFNQMSKAKKSFERSDMLRIIQKSLLSNFGLWNNFKKQVGEEWKITLIKKLWNENNPIILVKSEKSELFFIDILNNNILFECGNVFEKWYAFGWNKIFIFSKNINFSIEEFRKEIENFVLQNNNANIWDFLDHLKVKYWIQDNMDLKKISGGKDNFFDQNIDISLEYETVLKSLFFIITNARFFMKKKQIFIENELWKLFELWLWDSLEKPSKLKELYKWDEAIQIPVVENNSKKIIVTTWTSWDIFDVD